MFCFANQQIYINTKYVVMEPAAWHAKTENARWLNSFHLIWGGQSWNVDLTPQSLKPHEVPLSPHCIWIPQKMHFPPNWTHFSTWVPENKTFCEGVLPFVMFSRMALCLRQGEGTGRQAGEGGWGSGAQFEQVTKRRLNVTGEGSARAGTASSWADN